MLRTGDLLPRFRSSYIPLQHRNRFRHWVYATWISGFAMTGLSPASICRLSWTHDAEESQRYAEGAFGPTNRLNQKVCFCESPEAFEFFSPALPIVFSLRFSVKPLRLCGGPLPALPEMSMSMYFCSFQAVKIKRLPQLPAPPVTGRKSRPP